MSQIVDVVGALLTRISRARRARAYGLLVGAMLVISAAYIYSSRPNAPNDPKASRTASPGTTISIPKGAAIPPPSFSVTELLTDQYQYPFNFTVVIGINNTVTWVNHDSVSHTVSSFLVPEGAGTFNSDLIPPGGNFTTELTVPGIYKYTCMWHPWLAGQINVLPNKTSQ